MTTPTLTYKQDHLNMLSTTLDTPQNCNEVRAFFLEAIDPATDLHTHYRAYEWPIEQELMQRLAAFDQDYELALHNLKLLRRFLLQRYSFHNARKVDRLLRERGARRLWLFKDYLVPRIGLSLMVGFGITIGSSRLFDGLKEMAEKKSPALWVTLFCAFLIWFLIYLNVRERLGGGDRAVHPRTLLILVGAISWTSVELLVIYFLSLTMRSIFPAIWTFRWLPAAETGAVALVFAILTQFFFTKAGSMAEPL